MEIRFRLDDKVDADVISEIEKVSNKGPVSKALYRIVLEWYFLRGSNFIPKNQDFAANQGELEMDQGQNENDIVDIETAIDKDW